MPTGYKHGNLNFSAQVQPLPIQWCQTRLKKIATLLFWHILTHCCNKLFDLLIGT